MAPQGADRRSCHAWSNHKTPKRRKAVTFDDYCANSARDRPTRRTVSILATLTAFRDEFHAESDWYDSTT